MALLRPVHMGFQGFFYLLWRGMHSVLTGGACSPPTLVSKSGLGKKTSFGK